VIKSERGKRRSISIKKKRKRLKMEEIIFEMNDRTIIRNNLKNKIKKRRRRRR
jgi:hypothetical protein